MGTQWLQAQAQLSSSGVLILVPAMDSLLERHPSSREGNTTQYAKEKKVNNLPFQ